MRPTLLYATMVEAITAYRKKMGEVDAEMERRKGDLFGKGGGCVSCTMGCSHCCKLLVRAGIPDALSIALHLRESGRDTKELRGLLREEQLFIESCGSHDRYYEQKHPCVFLDDDSLCSVYQFRPLTCRDLYVLSPMDTCRDGKFKSKKIDAMDIRENFSRLWAEWAGIVWTVSSGTLPGMVLMALEDLDAMFRRSGDERDYYSGMCVRADGERRSDGSGCCPGEVAESGGRRDAAPVVPVADGVRSGQAR